MGEYFVQRDGQRSFSLRRKGSDIVLPYSTKLGAMRAMRDLNRAEVSRREMTAVAITIEPAKRSVFQDILIQADSRWKAQGE